MFYSHSLCVTEKSIDIIPFPNLQNFLTVHLPLLIHNAMARDLSDRWGSQKGHIETWYTHWVKKGISLDRKPHGNHLETPSYHHVSP